MIESCKLGKITKERSCLRTKITGGIASVNGRYVSMGPGKDGVKPRLSRIHNEVGKPYNISFPYRPSTFPTLGGIHIYNKIPHVGAMNHRTRVLGPNMEW